LKDRANGSVRRRRRSWYRRSLRMRRGATVAVLVAVIGFVWWQNAARILHLPNLSTAQVLPDSFWKRANLRRDLALTPPHAKWHPKYVARIPGVYPYSVIPGGIRDMESLRKLAAQDRAVSKHYAQFDYANARFERVTEPREVYVSYRIRDTIFWTRRKIRLQVGEMLLTDGKITARARCGNQISEAAKPEVSNEEPEEDVLDQPVALEPMGPSTPIRPVLEPPDLPAGQPIAPKLFANGFSFPIVPVGGAPVVGGPCKFEDGKIDKKCFPHRRHSEVPEPSTLLLIAPGFGLILRRWQLGRPAGGKGIAVVRM
jgi:hypothetical protein